MGAAARWMWLGFGWAAVVIGGIAVVVPGLPTTVFFVIAAWCFSKSSPRFEQWVMSRPGIGPLVGDYRAGLGMPRRAKIAATTSIAVVCGLSATFGTDAAWLRAIIALAGATGIGWILWRIPTRPLDPAGAAGDEDARATIAPPPAPRHDADPARWFRWAAIAEAVSWVGLLIGMFLKYVADAGELGVRIFGQIHGIVVLVYIAVTLWTWRRLRWNGRTLVLALLASVPPLATLAFEVWARRTGRLAVDAGAGPRSP